MVEKIAKWIARHPKFVVFFALILIVPAFFGFILTGVNYDMLSYLPDSLESAQGMNILAESGSANMTIIVMNNMSWDAMSKTRDTIEGYDIVDSAVWIGSLSDSPIPVSMLPESIASVIYNADGTSTLMLVMYKPGADSEDILKNISSMKAELNKGCLISGLTAVSADLLQMTNTEAPKYVAIAVALALLALMFTMDSFALPFILLIALGIAIIYNMGTNIIFGEISFITQAIAAILQLAVTMDYAVFIMDRYNEEKKRYRTREAAMAKAIEGTFSSLTGSSLTTIFGFLALCFMSLTLGRDIGLVMAKGVVFGVLTVIIILPAILLLAEPIIIKTRHKSLLPSFSLLNKGTVKARRILAILFVLLLVPAYVLQKNVPLYYNMMKAVPEGMASIEALDYMKDEFNMASTHFVLVSEDLPGNEVDELIEDLNEIDGISGAIGVTTVLGTALPANILPDALKSKLINGGYQLLMVNSVFNPAEESSNEQVGKITALIKSYDPKAILTGEGAMYKDLIEVASRDFIVTNIISIAAIFILIAILFKSITVPAILVLSIELAIWINMAICYFQGDPVMFVTPTIISCVQLGATVDYAILLTTRFREEIRNGRDKREAMRIAADASDKSIFQSALVFFAATIGVFIVSDIDIVKVMCGLFARGAVISAASIILFLTPVLIVSNGVIEKTTHGWSRPADPAKRRVTPFEIYWAKVGEYAESRVDEVKERRQARAEKKAAGKHKKAIPVPTELVQDTITDLDAAKNTWIDPEEVDKALAADEAKARSVMDNPVTEAIRNFISDSAEDFDLEEQRIPDDEINGNGGNSDD